MTIPRSGSIDQAAFELQLSPRVLDEGAPFGDVVDDALELDFTHS